MEPVIAAQLRHDASGSTAVNASTDWLKAEFVDRHHFTLA
jgi:hypothetical protein